jgi:hypothetical protein
MYCKNCGKEISENQDALCLNCKTGSNSKDLQAQPEPATEAAIKLFIKCRICGNTLEEAVLKCPYCGIDNPDSNKYKSMRNAWFIIGAVFLLLVIISTIKIGSTPDGKEEALRMVLDKYYKSNISKLAKKTTGETSFYEGTYKEDAAPGVPLAAGNAKITVKGNSAANLFLISVRVNGNTIGFFNVDLNNHTIERKI